MGEEVVWLIPEISAAVEISVVVATGLSGSSAVQAAISRIHSWKISSVYLLVVAYAASRSKGEIKADFAEADLPKVRELAQGRFTVRDALFKTQSSWTMVGVPNFGEYEGLCRDLLQSSSHRLWSRLVVSKVFSGLRLFILV